MAFIFGLYNKHFFIILILHITNIHVNNVYLYYNLINYFTQ